MNTAVARSPSEVLPDVVDEGSTKSGRFLGEEDKHKLESFCEAVRAKKIWYHKILDQERNLAIKWAQEAGYLRPGGSGAGVDFAILGAIQYVILPWSLMNAMGGSSGN